MSALHTPPAPPDQPRSEYILYVGNYAKGIYAYRFHVADGRLEALGIKGEIENPSFLALDSARRHLYAVSELDGHVEGAVGGFEIDAKTGNLKKLNTQNSAGIAPCHLAVDHSGKLLLAANYGTGTVSAFPIAKDGTLGAASAVLKAEGSSADAKRQKGPHAHQVVISADNKYVYVPDLGLDQIRIYQMDSADGTLKAAEPLKEQPGLGPRHMVFSPDAHFVYIFNELKTVVTVYRRETPTTFRLVQTLTSLPDSQEADGGAEILINRAGTYVYTSNRDVANQRPGSITVFAVDKASGKLQQVQNVPTDGKMPRGVEFDPSGRFLLVGDQKTNHIQVFKIDEASGRLTQTATKYETPSPVSFVFVPVK